MSFTKRDLKALRRPYRLLITGLMLLSIAIITFPIFWFGSWLANRLGMPALNVPVRDAPHGLLFLILSLVGSSVLLLTSYLVVFGLLATVLRWRAGWSSTEAFRFVFYSEVPTSWLESPLDA